MQLSEDSMGLIGLIAGQSHTQGRLEFCTSLGGIALPHQGDPQVVAVKRASRVLLD